MKVGIIGSGGREHSICQSLKNSRKISKIFCFPGNAGTAEISENINLDLNSFETVKDFILEQNIDLIVVGPEKPLVDGLVDYLEKFKIQVFGPNKLASQLEGSKIFTKKLCKKYNIPTANFGIFQNKSDAKKFLTETKYPTVIKADNLASGKGVYICNDQSEAHLAVDEIFNGKFGEAKNLLIEEFLSGEEMSFFIISDGKTFKNFGTAQDHKRVLEGDKGKNTGGMGAYSPTPLISKELNEEIMKEIIYPTLAELKRRNIEYKGFLYAGLMIDNQEIKVLEYNCRFGDPETQPILMRMKSDFLSLCLKAAKQELKGEQIEWDERFALGVVMASKGYPEKYETGFPILGIKKENETTKVFHCGTKKEGEEILSNGGRVLCVTGLGNDLDTAFEKAYEATSQINWSGAFYRKDIGKRNQ